MKRQRHQRRVTGLLRQVLSEVESNLPRPEITRNRGYALHPPALFRVAALERGTDQRKQLAPNKTKRKQAG
jgi:hypothetical protein